MQYNQREIVLVPFPYSDLSSSKKRPVLIVSNDDYNKEHDEVVVCVITSNLSLDEYSILLENSDLEYGLLPEKSVVKVHKLFTIHKTKIIKKFSVVSDDYQQKIHVSLTELFKMK
ncbi:MAG: type II toxin-antitoxin system PemK/MazF family toxin [Ignavibacteriales bacterium]|nr:type II toxin-antitoxin system PemK/MazF family toxin [Ignavibacteriales bacterium]